MANEQPLTDEHILPKPHDYSKYTGTLKSMMKRLKGENEDRAEVGPLSIQYSRGLTNPTGENNCFVNSAVQALWHMDVFRKSFKSVDCHACMGDACIFCALKVLFTQFQYSDKDSLPPDALRKALAISFMKEQRFQLRSMDDAAECFENILLQIHYCLTDQMEDSQCNLGHCIPHVKFAMTVLNQSECECGATSEPFLYKEFVRYISSTQLCTEVKNLENWRHSASFGQVLSNAATEKRDCPSNCGKTAEVKRDLLNCPDVVTIGISWDRDPSHHHISEVIRGIKGTLRVNDIYVRVLESQAGEGTFELGGLIAYYGKHYCTFFYQSSLKQWLYLEDTTVRPLGPSWSKVVEICIKSHYQPSLLFYCNPNWTRIDTSSAPTETNLLPGYTITCKSPDATNHHGAGADYWPIKKIPEHEGNPESPLGDSWTPVYLKKDVVEIGQAALGLVEEPEVTPPNSWNEERSSLDKQNNNRPGSPSSTGRTKDSNLNLNARVGSKVQSGVRGETAPSTTDSLPRKPASIYNQRETKGGGGNKTLSESKSHLYSHQVPQGQILSQDLLGGIDADGWKKRFEKQKETDSKERDELDSAAGPAKTSPRLIIQPIPPFDMSVFDADGTETTEEQTAEGKRTEHGSEELQSRKMKSYSSLDGQYEDTGDTFLLHHNNAFVDADEARDSYVMIPASSSATYRRPPSDTSPQHQSYTSPQHQSYTSPKHQSYTSPQHQSYTSPQHQSYTSDYLSGSAGSAGNLRVFNEAGTTRSQPLKHSASFTHGKSATLNRQDRSEGLDLPVDSQLGYGEDSWEDVAACLFVPGVKSSDPPGVLRKPDRNQVKTTDVRRTLSLGPQALRPSEWNKETVRTQTLDRTANVTRGDDEVARLWREAKFFLDKSGDAQRAGDNAVANGHCLQAAIKLRTLLRKDVRPEERELFIKIYDKTKINILEFKAKLAKEECSKTYSRSSSSGIEDDYHEREGRSQPFLQDAVEIAKQSLPNGGRSPTNGGTSPTNPVPVTYWKDNGSAARGQMVRHVPIIVEGSHGNAGYRHHGNTTRSPPHLKPVKPVRVSSTLPRQGGPSSRQFFVTASNWEHR